MGKGLYCTFGPEVRTSDAYDHDKVDAFGLPEVTHSLAVCEQCLRSLSREMFPSEEIIAGAGFIFKYIQGRKCLVKIFIVFCIFYKGAAASQIYLKHSH